MALGNFSISYDRAEKPEHLNPVRWPRKDLVGPTVDVYPTRVDRTPILAGIGAPENAAISSGIDDVRIFRVDGQLAVMISVFELVSGFLLPRGSILSLF